MKLYKYTGSLLAALPHPTFYQGGDQFVQRMMLRPKPTDGSTPSPPTINMWLYFWHTTPDHPSTVFYYPERNHMLDIHPGLNRFIGRGLRNTNEWLDARIISVGEPYLLHHTGIQCGELLDAQEFEFEGKDLTAGANRAVYDWSVGTYSPERSQWFRDVPAWVAWALGKTRAELVLADGRTVALNPSGRKIIRVSVRDHAGFIPAVQHLFAQLDPIVKKTIRKHGPRHI